MKAEIVKVFPPTHYDKETTVKARDSAGKIRGWTKELLSV